MITRIVIPFVVGVCCALATEESEFATTELPKRHSDPEDRLLTNIIRVTNSSQLTPDKNAEEESKKTADKKPRTVIHRDSNHDSRDKSIFFTEFSSFPAFFSSFKSLFAKFSKVETRRIN